MKGTGKFYGMGDEGIVIKGEWDAEGADQMRMRVVLKVKEQTFTASTVINGPKGWDKLNEDKANPMPKDIVTEERERMYCNWGATLIPLKGKGFKLSPLPAAKVGDQETLGVRVGPS